MGGGGAVSKFDREITERHLEQSNNYNTGANNMTTFTFYTGPSAMALLKRKDDPTLDIIATTIWIATDIWLHEREPHILNNQFDQLMGHLDVPKPWHTPILLISRAEAAWIKHCGHDRSTWAEEYRLHDLRWTLLT